MVKFHDDNVNSFGFMDGELLNSPPPLLPRAEKVQANRVNMYCNNDGPKDFPVRLNWKGNMSTDVTKL